MREEKSDVDIIFRPCNKLPTLLHKVPTLQLLTMKFSSAAVALLAAASGASAFCPAPTSSRRPTTSLFASDVILKKQTGYSSLDPAVIARYNALPFPDDKILAEYVWVDADGNTRSKTRTLDKHKVRLLVVFCVSMMSMSRCTFLVYSPPLLLLLLHQQ
jgi:hypothetical protein